MILFVFEIFYLLILFNRETADREISPICWFVSHMCEITGTGPGSIQELGINLGFPLWVTGLQSLKPSLDASQAVYQHETAIIGCKTGT